MPTYVYACSEKDHARQTVVHRVDDLVVIRCASCGKKMHRVPQPFRWGLKPLDVLYEKIERREIS